ncbi:MAG: hypothetical protein A2033_03005 [Bacteroidetes bacterium GWA2_31_9]|nr:MAG: hypothetical protein A2033_03005 [Bacteroidetes bacterium GWA2_31_9]
MKKKMYFIAVLFLAILTVTTQSCKKGEDGVDGAPGTAGTNGTDGYGAVTAADQAAFDAADGTIGARLYDHPLNEINYLPSAVMSSGSRSNFFRCKSCHGWDLRGRNGVLIDKGPSSSYPVAADVDLYAWARLHSIREVFDAVKNVGGRNKSLKQSYNGNMPYYGEILNDSQIWQIVKFLKVTSHNTDDFYDIATTGTYPTGSKTFSNIGKGGNATNGKVVYDSKCKSCHGADGKTIDIYCKGLFLGEMFRLDPHEVHHKAIWGMPVDRENVAIGCTSGDYAMPQIAITDQDIRDMMVMGQDTVLFPW